MNREIRIWKIQIGKHKSEDTNLTNTNRIIRIGSTNRGNTDRGIQIQQIQIGEY